MKTRILHILSLALLLVPSLASAQPDECARFPVGGGKFCTGTGTVELGDVLEAVLTGSVTITSTSATDGVPGAASPAEGTLVLGEEGTVTRTLPILTDQIAPITFNPGLPEAAGLQTIPLFLTAAGEFDIVSQFDGAQIVTLKADNANKSAMVAGTVDSPTPEGAVLMGGNQSGTLRAVSVSSAGVVSVGDGGGSLTVDGTVSVSEPVSVDDNGGSLTIDMTSQAAFSPGADPSTGIGMLGARYSVVDTSLPFPIAYDNDDAGDRIGVPIMGHSSTGNTWQGIQTDANGDIIIVDGGGMISIDDGAGSITVDGNVSVIGVPAFGAIFYDLLTLGAASSNVDLSTTGAEWCSGSCGWCEVCNLGAGDLTLRVDETTGNGIRLLVTGETQCWDSKGLSAVTDLYASSTAGTDLHYQCYEN